MINPRTSSAGYAPTTKNAKRTQFASRPPIYELFCETNPITTHFEPTTLAEGQSRLLLLDEPSLGLSPGSISTAFERIQQINAERGTAILIVEQKVRKVPICHRVYGIKLGKSVFSGPPSDLENDAELRKVFL